MDPATIGGILVAFGSLIVMTVMEGGNPAALVLPAPMILVLGGSIGVGIASSTLPASIAAVKALPEAFLFKRRPPVKTIDQLVSLAETARKQGLLALEGEAGKVDDPFLRKALQNVADGMDAEELRTLLEDEAGMRERRRRGSAKFFNALGGFAPTVGIMGTVVSLTHVLENLSNPETLGHSIAGAFIATLWGVMSANFFWLPIGARMNTLADLEAERLTLLIEGVMALQSGAKPRVLGEKLLAMVPESEQGAGARSSEKGRAPAKAAAAGAEAVA
jgi:chemotaxis protein MotA